jgi:hypothetical protein
MKGTPAKVNWGLTKRPRLSELILGRVMKMCARCGAATFWSAPGQRERGFCAHHAVAEPVDEIKAVGVVMDTFDGIEVDFDVDSRPLLYPVSTTVTGRWLAHWAPYRYKIETYPRDAGPCEGCRRPVRRYGPGSYAYCQECRP